MKLTELEPSWITTSDGRRGMGVVFLCPCCRDTSLCAWFANPLDGGPPAGPEHGPAPRWRRSGDTFETLTVTPSIDASAAGHWHGFVTNGEVT